jgi:hypothetical protein
LSGGFPLSRTRPRCTYVQQIRELVHAVVISEVWQGRTQTMVCVSKIRPLFSTTQKVRHQAATAVASTCYCYACCYWGGEFERPQGSRLFISTIYRHRDLPSPVLLENRTKAKTKQKNKSSLLSTPCLDEHPGFVVLLCQPKWSVHR